MQFFNSLDRKSEPGNAVIQRGEEELSHLNKKEQIIARALMKSADFVLGTSGFLDKPTELNDNFFFVGGNSLNAVRFITKMRDQGFSLGDFLFVFTATTLHLIYSIHYE